MAQRMSDVPSSRGGSKVPEIEKPSVPDGSPAGAVAGRAILELRFSGCIIVSFAFSAELSLSM